MRRGFWVALGLGAGATGAIIATRWARRQANRVKPATLAREARGGLLDLSKLVAESLEEGKRAMEERERELRSELEADGYEPPDPDEPDAA
ncbi:MAG TPA: hypothetical protein VFC08_03655 [Actinomycetota bacterium]|nr:hypothetical protein [Actinomycetota bacterium]